MTKCVLCNGDCSVHPASLADSTTYNCPFCGRFSVTGSAERILGSHLVSPVKSTLLSHVSRRASDDGSPLILNTDVVEKIVDSVLPTPHEQADLLIRLIGRNSPYFGAGFVVDFAAHGAVIGSVDERPFSLIVNHLINSNLLSLERQPLGGKGWLVSLTFDGWSQLNKIKAGDVDYRKAFIAMKFGDPVLNMVLEEVLRPSTLRAGFRLFKLDDIPKAGLIDDRLRVEIQTSDFLIADLTHNNAGAYWEAGYAEGLGKPVIYICEKAKFDRDKTHFDTNHHLTICWEEGNLKEAGDQLTATIRATLPTKARLQDPSDGDL